MELVAGIVVVVVVITLLFEVSQARWRREERAAGDPRGSYVAPDLRLIVGGKAQKAVVVPARRPTDAGEDRERPRSA